MLIVMATELTLSNGVDSQQYGLIIAWLLACAVLWVSVFAQNKRTMIDYNIIFISTQILNFSNTRYISNVITK
jgi:hypothetical protein